MVEPDRRRQIVEQSQRAVGEDRTAVAILPQGVGIVGY